MSDPKGKGEKGKLRDLEKIERDRMEKPIRGALKKDEVDLLKDALLPWDFAFSDFTLILEVACGKCAVNCVRFLLLNGTKPDANAMNAAIEGGNREIIALISRIVFDEAVWEHDEVKWKCSACEKWDFEVLDWLIRTREGGMNEKLLSVAMKSRDLVTVMLLLDRGISITQRLRLRTRKGFPDGIRDLVHFSDDPIHIRLTLNAIFVDFVRWKMPEMELPGNDFASNLRSIVETGEGLRLAELPFYFDDYHLKKTFLPGFIEGESWIVSPFAEIAPQRTALFEVQLRWMNVTDMAVKKEWELMTAVCTIREPSGANTVPFTKWIIEGKVDDVCAVFDAVNRARILVEGSPFPFSLSDLMKFIADEGKFSRSALISRGLCENGVAVQKGQDRWLSWLIPVRWRGSNEFVLDEEVSAAARLIEDGIFFDKLK
jgi:hypothetical protein